MSLRRKLLGAVVLAFFAVPLMLSAGAHALDPQAKVKAAFIYNGPIGDHGWIFAHEKGRRELQKGLSYTDTAYTESVQAGDAERIMTRYMQKGYNLIFGATFEYMDTMLSLAKRNPDVKVHLVWTLSWYDPAKEREAGESLMDIGADVLAQYFNSPAVQQAAQRRGKYSVGVYSDMSAFAPKAHLTAAIFNWGGFYKRIARQVHEGTWKTGSYWPRMKEGVVGLAPFGPMVPQSVRDLVGRRKAEILSGQRAVFHGPVKDQSGKVRVRAGANMPIKDLLSMNFLVMGIVGKIPK